MPGSQGLGSSVERTQVTEQFHHGRQFVGELLLLGIDVKLNIDINFGAVADAFEDLGDFFANDVADFLDDAGVVDFLKNTGVADFFEKDVANVLSNAAAELDNIAKDVKSVATTVYTDTRDAIVKGVEYFIRDPGGAFMSIFGL